MAASAAAWILLAAGLAACGGSGSSTSSHAASGTSSGSTASTTTSTTTTTATATSSATATATPQAVAGAPTCLTRNLKLAFLSGGGAAGTAYSYYAFTNAGATACSMIGYPGVSIVDAHGNVVQHPATRGADISVAVRLVTVLPGQRAKFLVNSTDTIPSPGCQHAYHGTTLQVFPPNQRSAILLSDTGPFCNLKVGPVQGAS